MVAFPSLIVSWQHVLELSSGTPTSSAVGYRLARQLAATADPSAISQPVASGVWSGPVTVGWAPTPENSPPYPSPELDDHDSEGFPPPQYPYGSKTFVFFCWDIVVQMFEGSGQQITLGWSIWPSRTPPAYDVLVSPQIQAQIAKGGGRIAITATASYVWNIGGGIGANGAFLDAIDASLLSASGAPVELPFNAIYDDFVSAVTSPSPSLSASSLQVLTASANAGFVPDADPVPLDITADLTVGPMEPPWNEVTATGYSPPPKGPPPHPVLKFQYWLRLDPSVDPNSPGGGTVPFYAPTFQIEPNDELYALAVYAETPPIASPPTNVLVVPPGVRRGAEAFLVLAQSDAGMVLVPIGGGSPGGPGDPAARALAQLLRTAYAVATRTNPASLELESDEEE